MESTRIVLQSEGKQLLFGCNYDLQTEAVHKAINFTDFMYFSEISLQDCCIQMKMPKTLKLGIHGDAHRLGEIPSSMGEIASNYRARPIIGELL